MTARIANILYHVRTGFWFVPTLITVMAMGLAELMLAIDRSVPGGELPAFGGFFRLGTEGARLFLSTIAGSMITVTSLVFSLTLVALTMASSQLGPRLLSSFMRDRVTQVVLGTFLGTFVYSLLVMRSPSEETGDVPDLAVTVALFLAVSSFGLLIYFIHHVAHSIQADTVIARVAADLRGSIDELFRQIEDEGKDDPGADDRPRQDPAYDESSVPIACRGDGYVQAIAYDDLIALAVERDAAIRLKYRAGQFVVEGQTVAEIAAGGPADEAVSARINNCIVVGPIRTMAQDVQYALAALVEVALRALSPGVNDPHTAIACIDHISAELAYATRRGLPPSVLMDGNGKTRVIAEAVSYDELVATAFDEIRQCGCGNVSIAIRLVEAIGRLLPLARSESQRRALRRQAEMIERAYEATVAEPNDRAEIEKRLKALANPPA